MTTIIDAIINLVNNPKINLTEHYKSTNRANNIGDALEEYIKDLFAGTIDETDDAIRNRKISTVFSYLGNASNPPDSMLRNGDAIEVKKAERITNLQLNSSHPKRYLRRDNPRISKACRESSDWCSDIRDILYVVGICNDSSINHLCMVFGTELCADMEIYTQYEEKVKNALCNIENTEFAETNELGRLNKVDPLGITSFRIRGMWLLENPIEVFKYIYRKDSNNRFNFMALINNEKFYSLPDHDSLIELSETHEDLFISDAEVKDPNNPANLIPCKLITFFIKR